MCMSKKKCNFASAKTNKKCNINMLYRKISTDIEAHLRSGNDKIMVVEGARQIGKSYIVREVGNRLYKNFIEVNFVKDDEEDGLFRDIHKLDEFYMTLSMVAGGKLGDKSDTLVFLDEIQHYPQYLTMLKFLREEARFTYIASGSLLGIALRNTASIPVGSIIRKQMFQLDFEEWLIAEGWGKTVNLSLVDMIIGNILYINGTHYILDRMFAETVLKAFHSVDRNDTESAVPSAYNDSVFLRIGNEYRRVRIDEIQWIESFHNYCDIYTASSPRPYCSDFSMNVWLKILPEDHFVRLHRSAIVNVNYVDAIQAGKVSIQGHSFEVPRTQRREIPKRFHLIQRKQTDKRLSKWLEKHTQ